MLVPPLAGTPPGTSVPPTGMPQAPATTGQPGATNALPIPTPGQSQPLPSLVTPGQTGEHGGTHPPDRNPHTATGTPPNLVMRPVAPIRVGTTSGTTGGEPSHAVVVHRPPDQRPVTSGPHLGSTDYTLEYIEPGIQNHRVEVYRSQDAHEVVYGDAIPLDQGGFNLTVVGIRNPDYAH